MSISSLLIAKTAKTRNTGPKEVSKLPEMHAEYGGITVWGWKAGNLVHLKISYPLFNYARKFPF